MSYLMLSTFSLRQGLFSLNLDHTNSLILTGLQVPEIFLSGSVFPVLGTEQHTTMSGFLCEYWVWVQVLMLGQKSSSNPTLEDFNDQLIYIIRNIKLI